MRVLYWERDWRTYASSEGKLQIVSNKGAVCDGIIDALIEEVLVAVEVLSDAEPETEKLCSSQYGLLVSSNRIARTHRRRAEHVVVRYDSKFPPTIHHGKKTQVVVAHFLRRLLAQAELVQELIM